MANSTGDTSKVSIEDILDTLNDKGDEQVLQERAQVKELLVNLLIKEASVYIEAPKESTFTRSSNEDLIVSVNMLLAKKLRLDVYRALDLDSGNNLYMYWVGMTPDEFNAKQANLWTGKHKNGNSLGFALVDIYRTCDIGAQVAREAVRI